MQQGTMANGRLATARGMSVLWLVIALLVGFVTGALSLAAFEQATLRPPVTNPPASAPRPVVEPEPAGQAMSAREAAQYRAFYAQQMASEAELELWSLAPRPAPRVNRAQRDFYAQQTASEAELERWAAPAQPSGGGQGGSSAPRVSDGAQFE